MELIKFGAVELSVKGVSFLVFSLLAIAAVGYLVGRITIKGVNLGTAGVFLVALLYGALFYSFFEGQFTVMAEGMAKPENYAGNVLKIVENIGLILFVTSVGFIAGPKFFGDLKRNFKTYILLGVVIIVSGALACVGCTAIALSTMDVPREDLISIMVGLFAGALTSTPAFSAAKEAVGAELADKVSVGNGIAYIFGVIGVVLFVQLIPKFLKADMAVERAKLAGADKSAGASGDEPTEVKQTRKLIEIDGFGIAPFAIAAIIGMLLGSIKFGAFSITTTGGCLLTALVFGHFSHFGPIKVMPPVQTLKVFREFGLMMFLIGAGVAGGAKFVQYFQPVYFLYGAVMTLVPMIIGFIFAKFILKLNLLNTLGSITGGMTSTPALGTLISVAGTEDVAAAYASTYPIALISVVLCSQFIIMFFL